MLPVWFINHMILPLLLSISGTSIELGKPIFVHRWLARKKALVQLTQGKWCSYSSTVVLSAHIFYYSGQLMIGQSSLMPWLPRVWLCLWLEGNKLGIHYKTTLKLDLFYLHVIGCNWLQLYIHNY